MKSNLNISIKEALALIAEAMLPKFSGQNKMLQVMIQLTPKKGKYNYLEVIFWRPQNYMMVAYDFSDHMANLSGKFSVTANHDSTWTYDGFGFFNTIEGIVGEIKSLIITSVKIMEIESYDLKNDEREFSYVLK